MTLYEEYRRIIYHEEALSPQGRRWLSTAFECGRDAALLQGLDHAILHVLTDHFPNRAPDMRALHRELEMCLEHVRSPSTWARASRAARWPFSP